MNLKGIGGVSGCDAQFSMDLSRIMVHVKQVEDSRKKRRVCEVRRPNPFDQTGSNRGGGRSTFVVRDQPRRVQHPEEADPSARMAVEVYVQRPKKEYGSCGRIHSGECKLGTNVSFACGKS